MFVTSDALVQHLHPSSVLPPQNYWRTVTLTLQRHWYLLVFNVMNEGRKVPQTALVAWDETLIDLLAEIPRADLGGIGRLDWQTSPSAPWSLRWIDALWKPSRSETHTIGPLVFTLDADPQARDIQLRPVNEHPDRELLFQATAVRQ